MQKRIKVSLTGKQLETAQMAMKEVLNSRGWEATFVRRCRSLSKRLDSEAKRTSFEHIGRGRV